MINCRLSKEHVRVSSNYQGLEKEDNVLESGFMAFHQTVVHRVLQELEDANSVSKMRDNTPHSRYNESHSRNRSKTNTIIVVAGQDLGANPALIGNLVVD